MGSTNTYEYLLMCCDTDPETGCMIWAGARSKDNYGRGNMWGRSVYVHRYIAIASTFENKSNPKIKEMYDDSSIEACHKCDNPPCNNPDHLFLGTHLSNMRDAATKKRLKTRHGEDSHYAKLTEDIVKAIRADWEATPYNQRKLAKKYGVSQVQISHIVTRKQWAHVP